MEAVQRTCRAEIKIKVVQSLSDQFNMHSLKEIEKSQKLYTETKTYFMSLNLPDCVIEILDAPMSAWPIHLTPTDDSMRSLRIEFSCDKKSYLAIYTEPEGVYFVFMDYVTRTKELVSENKVISSNIVDVEERQPIDMNQVMKEFIQLKKMLLQGK